MQRFALAACILTLSAFVPAPASATSFGSCGDGVPVVHGSHVVMAADVGDVQWYTLAYLHNLTAITLSMLHNSGYYSLEMSLYGDATCSTPICQIDLSTPTGATVGCLGLIGPHDPASPEQYSIRMEYAQGDGTVVYSAQF